MCYQGDPNWKLTFLEGDSCSLLSESRKDGEHLFDHCASDLLKIFVRSFSRIDC
jgi:hypothetical protein